MTRERDAERDDQGVNAGRDGTQADEPAIEAASQKASEGRIGQMLSSDEFSFQEAVGGWRGFIESVAPGFVFVLMFLTVGGMRVPVIAAVATMAVLVVIRLIQRSSIQQALAGAVGVAIGAIWAWRTGEPEDYFVPGLWINTIYGIGTVISMVVRWPLVGIVVGLIHGDWKGWRSDPVQMRVFQRATAVLVGMYILRLAVQLPLYFTDQVAALGTARLAMGVPLFALTLWVVWLMVRNATPRPEPQDPPQPT
ncbi:DUF3159 domain-containing protein [Demequina flava]|uniref:DUF3159 domain-containing protein n=1 Tax=Demequina flava TaxID=1095025 RepID=UPI0007804EDE|nr:DUF3159 domain-containing protein [Demequina flava]